MYADADFAGDPATQRSTTGVHLCIEGENSHFPLHGVSKRQDSVSSSTPEAELVSGHYAYHKVLLPAMDLWETLLPTAGKGIFHEDNTARIQVIRTGRNPTMKHLHRVRRICVETLHERLGGNDPKDPIQLVYTPSDLMRADVYTKHMTNKDKFEHGLRMIGVFPACHLSRHFGK